MEQEQTTSETAETTASTGATETQTESTETSSYMTVKRRGQEVALTEKQAKDYASKGFDYETKNAELNAERERLKEYDQFDSVLKNDPRRQEAVRRAFENPDLVLNSGGGGDDGESEATEDRAVSSELETMRRDLDMMKRSQAEGAARAAHNAQGDQVSKVLSGFEFLSNKETATKLAKERATDLLARDKTMTVDTAVGQAVNEVIEVLKENANKELEHQDRQVRFRTIRPSAGQPATGHAEKPKYTRGRIMKETHSAAMRDAMAAFPRAFGARD